VHQEIRSARVVAVERSADALVWLRRNAGATASDGRFSIVAGDIRDPGLVERPELAGVLGRVDAVLCNPPYVPSATAVDLEVRHDPVEAVFAGGDGLFLMTAVFALASRLLRPGGRIAVEHSESHGPALLRLAGSSGEWACVQDHRDLSGRDRFVTAVRA
jgi:release factor glutamine methyltransferase